LPRLRVSFVRVDVRVDMSLNPSLQEQELLAETFRREDSGTTRRELLAETLIGSGFLVAVAALWLAGPRHGFSVVSAVLCLLVLVLATRVHFDTPFGFTAPTQLAFVPLVFALPAAVVPIAVVLALTLARLPDIARGRAPASRLLRVAGNSWFAIGPAAVFALAGTEARYASAGLLLAALLAQFAVDFAVSTVRFQIGRGATIATQLREAWVYAIDAALSGVALVIAKDIHSQPAEVLAVVPLLGLFAVGARERHRRLESLLELNSAYRGTALVLGNVIEADDSYTGQHCRGVVGLALDVADKLKLGAEERRNLEFGALLHDVGKIAIPKEIINKPGKLNPEEWTIIKTHTLEGQKLLERVGGFMREVGLIVRSHHERWDGAGYPDGLAGEAIPLEARIIACCDTWNAMRTDRSYRKALSPEHALAELVANAGSQLDPRVVETVVQIVAPAGRPNRVPSTAHESNPARVLAVR
jgi:putative nucleotidyltransferase with HDIG domain